MMRDLLDEATAVVDGFNSYFSFSLVRSGYSGVATYCKDHVTPVRAENKLSGLLTAGNDASSDTIGYYGNLEQFTEEELKCLDNEGRAVMTEHKIRGQDGAENSLVVINVYCPRADPEREDRKSYKLRFYQLLQIRAEALLNSGRHVVIVGDVNTSHKPIDHCDPAQCKAFASHPGRKWLDGFLWTPEKEGTQPGTTNNDRSCEWPPGVAAKRFVDCFRFLHPTVQGAFTCWSTVTGARQTNYGTRIDYIFADRCLATTALVDCDVLQHVQGSDHCPVKATFNADVVAANNCPSLCTKYGFSGKQQKLAEFFPKTHERAVAQPLDVGTTAIARDRKPQSKQQSRNPAEHARKKAKIETGKQRTLAGFLLKGAKKLDAVDSSQLTVAKQIIWKDVLNGGSETITGTRVQSTLTSTRSQYGVDTRNNALTNELYFSVRGECNGQNGADNADVAAAAAGNRGKDPASNVHCAADAPAPAAAAKSQAAQWKGLLRGPPPPPVCRGHGEPCVLRTVKKSGPNVNRQFFVCARPEGHKSNKEARCEHFKWVTKPKKYL
ncbi:PREDICTED: DNA-(apurinic or apyrimidinic site) lyase 2-like isoform X2 [Priapulus caudatus]|uniref:DNA-(apurinic or apyrimidinic site) endonuclease n=1 Tax=Priapulus caudatus TaxID=37621 RepID=A0ABM1DZ59_PRICU|nr:PREDICTED: DNA-(apurinic or apyrimidinic site) lyase 2-like isoform X2 [Priapulus caudatus]